MQRFEIVLKNEKLKGYRYLALTLLALNSLIFLYLLFFDDYRVGAVFSFGLLLMYFLIQFFVKKKSPGTIDGFTLFIVAGCWIIMKAPLPALAMAILGLLYLLAIQPLKIVFSDDGVDKKNFPEKRFSWGEFSNVILKDDILTLDFNNNHILQKEIEGSTISEKEFNSFAHQQMLAKSTIVT